MYGRLQWHKPAQTITTGFGSMGQGRYVHPSQHRTFTPHQGRRLQTFPDWFDFGSNGRSALARMIGNAVPPVLGAALGARLTEALIRDGALISPSTSRRMRATGRRDTAAERKVRSALSRRGLKYRVDVAPLCRITLPCGHLVPQAASCSLCGWVLLARLPSSRHKPEDKLRVVVEELAANKERDRRTTAQLESAGWLVLRFWEHEPPNLAADRIHSAVVERRLLAEGAAN